MSKSRPVVKIGIDFDGVLAYNPFRIIRAPITYVKRRFFGIRKLRFYVPNTPFERFECPLLHESSVLPARGIRLLPELAARPDVKLYLVTARFGYLQPSLYRWLDRHGVRDLFADILINRRDEQPHEHKLQTINRLGLNYYIEDNWDIVEYLQGRTRVMWIYNIADRHYGYPDKYPFLEAALGEVRHNLPERK